MAYTRNRSSRMAFMLAGFMGLVVVEVLHLLSASGVSILAYIPMINVELPHLIMLIMISMFGLGILKVEK